MIENRLIEAKKEMEVVRVLEKLVLVVIKVL